MYTSKPWSFYSVRKNFGGTAPPRGRNMVFRKSLLSVYDCTSKSAWLVDQSSPNFFAERGRKRRRSPNFVILNTNIHSWDIRAQSGEGSEIAWNLACFWPQKFFGGQTPKFLDRDYKTEYAFEHRAKFSGNQHRDLGDLTLKKNKNCCKT